MTTDKETEIRNLIEGWARAVRAKQIEGVLDHHARDMVMFDVPPPVMVEGLDAYRDTWPPFFEWQRKAEGSFDIVSLDITAGDDVAFATALLRCGSKAELKKDDTPRLRLTVGLRKENGHWQIAHEHHSFPLENAEVIDTVSRSSAGSRRRGPPGARSRRGERSRNRPPRRARRSGTRPSRARSR